MNASRTKVFGMELTVDPKLIVLALIVLAGLIYYFTSNSETQSTGSASPAASAAVESRPVPGASLNARAAAARRANASRSDRNTLKLVPVDGSRGDVDPTLRLRLLDRLKNVPAATASRNIFDATGSAAVAGNLPSLPKDAPKIPVGPLPDQANASTAPAPPPPFSIPLKYFGFVRPTGQSVDGNRGFFMDGDNVLEGGEGDLLEKRFLIVALTPNTARLEDTQAKQGQDLQVTPEAQASQ